MAAAPAAGLVEMKAPVCPGFVLICPACVSTRLPWILDKVTESAEKQYGPSAVYGKSNEAADPLCKYLLALVHSAVEEGKVPGVEFAGDFQGGAGPMPSFRGVLGGRIVGDRKRQVCDRQCLVTI